jgi:hypothetical protein
MESFEHDFDSEADALEYQEGVEGGTVDEWVYEALISTDVADNGDGTWTVTVYYDRTLIKSPDDDEG